MNLKRKLIVTAVALALFAGLCAASNTPRYGEQETLHPYIHAEDGSCELPWNLCQKET